MIDHAKLLERLRTAPPNVLKDREAADAIATLQAEVARLQAGYLKIRTALRLDLHSTDNLLDVIGTMLSGRDSALARLAAREKQEPVGFVHSGELQMIGLGYAHIYPKQAQGAQQPLFAAAGASPVEPDAYNANAYGVQPLSTTPAAQPSQDADPNAPWLSEAHILCADQGIAPGHITDRIRALRDKLEQPSQARELSDEEIGIRIEAVLGHRHWNWSADWQDTFRKVYRAAINAKGDAS